MTTWFVAPNLARASTLIYVRPKGGIVIKGLTNNVLILPVIAVFVIIVAGVWFATEWTAVHLGFQARLGRPLGFAFGYPVYPPWRLFQWWYAYEAYAPKIFNTGGMIAGGAGIAGAMAAI